MGLNDELITKKEILFIIGILTYIGGIVGTIATINTRMDAVTEAIAEIKVNAAKMNANIIDIRVEMGKLQVEIRRQP